MPRSDTLSARLKATRAAAGLSQPELAERAGVPLPTVRSLEQGQRTKVWLETAAKLAQALGVTVFDALA